VVYRGLAMSDDDQVSRRDLFRIWARSFSDGVSEFVVPMVEQRLSGHQDLVQQLRDTLESGGGEEQAHPWRDLLMPPETRDS